MQPQAVWSGRRRHPLLMMAALALAAAAPAALLSRSPLRPAQTVAGVKDLAPGCFLVAQRDLPDPNFSQSVVLLVTYEKKGAMGLIINRRTRIPLSRVLQEMEGAKARTDPVYAGGPVLPAGALGLLRARAKPEEGKHVFSDVYLISSRALLEKTVAAGTAPAAFRLYLGYSGWAAGQLVREVETGSWHIFRGDPDLVFDPDPSSVWRRLIRRTELQIALRLSPGAASSVAPYQK